MAYLKITLKEFENIRHEIESSYSQTGCMEEEAAECAIKAYNSMKKVEKRNNIPPIVF